MHQLLSYLSAAAAAIIIHETGHIIAAALCGIEIKSIRSVALGLRLGCDDAGISYKRCLLLYAGGAAFNFLSLLIPHTGECFRSISLGAALFNLLPLIGSDGLGMLRCLLLMISRAPDAPARTDRTLRIISDAALILLWLSVIYVNLTGGGSLPALIIMVFFITLRCRA